MPSMSPEPMPEPLPGPWQEAMRRPWQAYSTQVDGAQISYRVCSPDDPRRPLLLFAHGYRGHSHWWDWIAPWFADRYRVAALDFSGMGDSQWRPRYDGACFAADLRGVLAALQAGTERNATTLIGHSIGGVSVLKACATEAIDTPVDRRRIGRAIVIDSWLRFPEHDPIPVPFRSGARRAYPDYQSARARFRLSPPQPASLPQLVEYVARHSLHETADGWRWRFDPNLPFAPIELDGPSMLSQVAVPVDVIYGECSTIVNAWRATETVTALPHGRGPLEIPHAFHHIMLDQPLALVNTLRRLLGY